jgi:hypothetical protein
MVTAEVVLVAVTVSVDDCEAKMLVGLATIVTVGAGKNVTAAVAVWVPPAPVAVAV